jgi:hypothetical protein
METIYTIPLNEAFGEHGGDCPLCRLTAKLDADTLEYALGAAMMEPDVRQAMNAKGFCRLHYRELAARRNKLALALVLETRLAAVLADAEVALGNRCFACERVAAREERYISNAVYLFAADAGFRAKFEAQENICLLHAGMLLSSAKKNLKRKQYPEFKDALTAVLSRGLGALKADARKLADSFDYRANGQEPGAEKDVLERAIEHM